MTHFLLYLILSSKPNAVFVTISNKATTAFITAFSKGYHFRYALFSVAFGRSTQINVSG